LEVLSNVLLRRNQYTSLGALRKELAGEKREARSEERE
jgi:hypothetical protein